MSDIDETVLEDLDIEAEDEEDDEAVEDEAAEFNPLDPLGLFGGGPFGLGNRRRRAPRTASGRQYYSPQFQPYVTQQQFSTALTRIRTDVTRNSTAIKAVDTRVAAEQAVNRAQNKALATQSKINKRQSAQIAQVKRDVQQAQQNSLLLMLLTRPKSLGPTTATQDIGGVDLPVGSNVLYTSGKDNSMLLAIMLMGGLGGGGDSGNQALMALAFADAF